MNRRISARTPHIARPLKRLVARLVVQFLEALIAAKNAGAAVLRVIFRPILGAFRIAILPVVLFVYRNYLRVRSRVLLALKPFTRRSSLLFSNRYLVHVIVIIIAVLVATSNINARELNTEEFGKRSIIAALVTPEIAEEVTEELSLEELSRPRVTDYMASEEGVVSAVPSLGIGGRQRPEYAVGSISAGEAVVAPTIAATTPNIKLRDGVIEHAVKSGETIGAIAEAYGVSVNTVLWANDLSSRSLIKPGQTLRILPVTGVEHTVKSNQTLDKIAGLYGVEAGDIADWNDLDEEDVLQVGQDLIVPGGTRLSAPAPSRPTRLTSVRNFIAPPSTTTTYSPDSKLYWPTTSTRISQYSHWGHVAIDLDGACGDPIFASESGVVTKVAYLNYGYGYHIIIDHGGGLTTLYAHFQRIYVEPGQSVARGETVGEQGTTGYSTGCHLHYEVKKNGTKYNPLQWL